MESTSEEADLFFRMLSDGDDEGVVDGRFDSFVFGRDPALRSDNLP